MTALVLVKIILSVSVIVFCSWLSAKNPSLAGFIVALPLVSMLVLVFSYVEHNSAETTIAFAKSIFVGIPASLLFFLPFLIADKFSLGFWACFVLGLMMLVIGYFAHRGIVGALLSQ